MTDVRNYCIAITTFSKRQRYIKNLVHSIRAQSDIDIYLCVNCDYNEPFDEDYRKFIMGLCSEYSNIYTTFYLKFRGLTKMWNDAIINGCKQYTCIMNDDSIVTEGFIDELVANNANNQDILKINNGWACFIVNKDYLENSGFFNEYYIGIGYEDCDFVRQRGDKPGYTTNKFIDLASESESFNSFPKHIEGDLARQDDKVYSTFNINLYHANNIGYVNPRPCESYYTQNSNNIF
jgi:hypothetical protein